MCTHCVATAWPDNMFSGPEEPIDVAPDGSLDYEYDWPYENPYDWQGLGDFEDDPDWDMAPGLEVLVLIALLIIS